MAPGMMAICVLTLVSFVWFAHGRWEVGTGAAPVAEWRDAFGSIAIAGAGGLFAWAVMNTRRRRLTLAFTLDSPGFVVQAGPYAWVRHPFYTSYLAFWVGTAVESPGWRHWAVPAAMAVVYVTAARMEEKRFASSGLAEEYAGYATRTGMMVPRVRRTGGNQRLIKKEPLAQPQIRDPMERSRAHALKGRAEGVSARLAAVIRERCRTGFGLAVPIGIPSIREEQARGLRVTALALSACGVAGVTLMMYDFRTQSGMDEQVIAMAIAGIYVAWVAISLIFGARPWFMITSIGLLCGQGILWSLLLFKLAEIATNRQSNFIVGVAMALVSAPILGAPFASAVAFWLPAAIGSWVTLTWGLEPRDPYLVGCFLVYVAFTAIGIVFINRTLLERSITKASLDLKNATVGLLLKDYEDNAADWLWETDNTFLLRGISSRFAQVLGSDALQAEGRTLYDVLKLEAQDNAPSHGMCEAMRERRPFRENRLRVRVGDEERWWSLTGRPVQGTDGMFNGYRGVGADVTEARTAEEATKYLATHDALTGLVNRSAFNARLNQACATQETEGVAGFALMMLDLDRFKEINDVHGHAFGDSVLSVVADRLRHNTRLDDAIARLGGDEFALMLPGMGPQEAADRAVRLIAAINERIKVGEAWVSVGASIGIAMYPVDGKEGSELTRNADLALYRAKESGRGLHQPFHPVFREEFQDRMALLIELKQAIDSGTMQIEFQPIIDTNSGRTVAMEALCRWQHATRGLIPPSVFVPLAEECGLIGRLGQQVLTQACSAGVADGSSIRIAVNLSPIQLRDPELVGAIKQKLDETGLDPARLELEITESAWLKGDAFTLEQLSRLDALGINVVMDDFGTGFSSLASLHSFRFRGLKIDAKFMQDVECDPKAGAIVRLVARLALELGIELTAEGVETEGQMALVKAFGIPRAQGYLVGKPGPWPNKQMRTVVPRSARAEDERA